MTLPSWSLREAAGDLSPETRRMARAERKALAHEGLRLQVFSILWGRHGTGVDEDRDLAWAWFNMWPTVNAGLATAGRKRLTAEAIADFVDGS